uniref:Uncharacterized protein n=1 Tax=Anguilla anguilla TaxID=7936 RepID=A0A0E9WG17_ANGAN
MYSFGNTFTQNNGIAAVFYLMGIDWVAPIADTI